MFGEDSKFKENIVFWKRQMDDIFFIWKGTKEDLELFVWQLNGVEYRVQFTLEVEREGFLPFLDVGITSLDGRLKTKVYRKPTHTQQYIYWNSNHPKNMLLGVLKGLIHRAHVICDEKKVLLEELELLRNVFICNGYPEHLVSATLKESWRRETLKAILKGVQHSCIFRGRLTWLLGLGESGQNLSRALPGAVGHVFVSNVLLEQLRSFH